MKVLSERLPDCQIKFSIEVESEEMGKALESAYQRLMKSTNIPGFRRGKAPREILERYIGRERIVEEAIRKLIPEIYAQILKENNIEPFAPPIIDIKREEPLSFTVIVPLKPIVELCDYHQIKLPLKAIPVRDEDVERVIEELRYEQAPWEPISREVRIGDMVTLDIEAKVEGKPYLNRAEVQYIVRPGIFPLPGFTEKLVGMKEGEEKEFALPFPPNHPHKGKECLFKVKIKELKGKSPLSLEELAKSLNFSDLPSLREEIASQLKMKAKEEAKRELGERILKEIIANSRIEFPPLLVEKRIEQLRGEGQGEELRLRAKREITRTLVLDKIMEKEGIKVEESEIDAEIERMTQVEKGEEIRRFFSSPQARNSLKEMLSVNKTLSRLVEICGKEGGDGS